jgi:hypothetical protein
MVKEENNERQLMCVLESRTSVSSRPVSINLQAVFCGRITSERDPREQARMFRAFWAIWLVADADDSEKGVNDRQGNRRIESRLPESR